MHWRAAHNEPRCHVDNRAVEMRVITQHHDMLLVVVPSAGTNHGILRYAEDNTPTLSQAAQRGHGLVRSGKPDTGSTPMAVPG
jgi:hypothetical protein